MFQLLAQDSPNPHLCAPHELSALSGRQANIDRLDDAGEAGAHAALDDAAARRDKAASRPPRKRSKLLLFLVYVHLMYDTHVKEFPDFDWDQHNEQHLAKHGITRAEAQDVLLGNHILLEYQMEGNEQRWIAVGATRANRILTIVFAVRGEAIRPITGWDADKETTVAYFQQWGRD